jgi:MFS family permease
VFFSSSSISVALPSISVSLTDIQGNLVNGVLENWIGVSLLLSTAIFSVPCGNLCEKFGLKKSFLFGLIIYSGFSIVSVYSNTVELLITLRFFQGLGASVINITTLSMITEALPPQERGKSIGLNISGAYIGSALAPGIGGFLTQLVGWKLMFLSILPFLILIILVTLLKIPQEWSNNKNEKFDYVGSFIYCLGIFLIVYGFTILNEITGIILVIIAIILLTLFVKWESSHETPVFNVKSLTSTVFTSSTISSLISYLATYSVTYIITYYLQYVKELDPQTSGFILIVTPIFMTILAPLSGRLSDKVYPQVLSAIGMSLVTISLIMLTFLSKTTPLYIIIISMVLQGVGCGLFSSPNTNTIMGSVPKHLSSSASASVSVVRVMGKLLGMGILTLIFAFHIDPTYHQIPHTLYQEINELIISSNLALTIFSILSFISIFTSLVGLKFKFFKK